MTGGRFRGARRGIAAAALAGLFLSGPVSRAANIWDGGGTPNNNWSTATNWDNNLVPTFPAQLTFGGLVNLLPNNDQGNVAVDGIIFDAVGGSFSIGGNDFTLGDPATADYRRNGVTNNNALLQTINNSLTLTRGQHIISTTTATGGLTLSGSLTRAAGSGAYFNPMAGTSIKTTLTNGASGIIGGWAATQNPTPDVLRPNATAAFYAKVDGSGNVVPYGDADYTADNDIDGEIGEMALPAGINANSNIRWRGAAAAGFNITIPAGTTNLNTFLFDGPQTQGSKRVEMGAGNILRYTSGGGVFRSNNTGTNTNVAGVEFNGTTTPIDGDYNNNGWVDAADYVVWRNAGPADVLPNDPTSGTVDDTDYTTWRGNFGKTRFGILTAGDSSAPAELVFTTNTALGTSAADPGEQHNRLIELINTVITDNPQGGAVTVVKNGPGAVRTSNGAATPGASHTFSGGLYLNRGVWRSDNTRNATGDNGAGFGLGPVYVASGAQAFPQTDQIINNDFFISGTGIDEGNFHVGAIRSNADGNIFNGRITLMANSRIGGRGSQATNAHFTDADLFNDGTLFNGKITGNFDLELNVQTDQGGVGLNGDMPTLILANSTNDWSGNTTIGRGRIRVGGTGEVIPHGPGAGDVTIRGQLSAAAPAGASGPSILTLDSRTETVNGLFSAGDLVDGVGNDLVFVTNSTVGEATLRVGANNATSSFGGVITDDTSVSGILKLVKIGSGTFTVTGDKNAWGGDTNIEGGKLTITTTAPNLADAADVRVLTGALLELDYGGTDFIDSLFLGGAQVAAGEWGSLASTALNKSAFLLGLGTLTVQTGPGSGALVGAVPEPGTVGLLIVAALFGGGVRRGRRSIV